MDITIPPAFFGNRALLGTAHEWRDYIKSCANAALDLSAALNSGRLIPLLASEELVTQTSVLTKPCLLNTEDSESVAVTRQAGYRLPGENLGPNAAVAVSKMRRTPDGRLFRSRSVTHVTGAIERSEVPGLGPKASANLVYDHTLHQNAALRMLVRRAQVGLNEIPGELYVPPEVKRLRAPTSLADAIAASTVEPSSQTRLANLLATAMPMWQEGSCWYLSFSTCRSSEDVKAVMLAHALSVHQTSHRREASSGRQFGVLPCFWALNTICNEVWEHVEHASDALIMYNPEGVSWTEVLGQYDKPLPAYAGLDMEWAREQADDVPDMQVLNYAETTGMPEVILSLIHI